MNDVSFLSPLVSQDKNRYVNGCETVKNKIIMCERILTENRVTISRPTFPSLLVLLFAGTNKYPALLESHLTPAGQQIVFFPTGHKSQMLVGVGVLLVQCETIIRTKYV